MYSFGLKLFIIYDHVTPAEMVDKVEVSLIRTVTELMEVSQAMQRAKSCYCCCYICPFVLCLNR